MTTLQLDPKTTALVVIDLQNGVVAMPTAPYSGADVLARSTQLAEAFRAKHGLVVLVRVDPGASGELFPSGITDMERPRMTIPAGWTEIAPAIGPKPGDVVVVKHQPGAFYATDLEAHLRRRRIETIVLCGIATNMGVEATARVGFEHGYNIVFASDAMASMSGEMHEFSVSKYFPSIGRVRTTQEIVASLK